MMRELHLFAGAGGGILGGLLLGHRPVGAVEIDPYCRAVLESRQADGLLPEFPIHADIRTFDARPWRGQADIVCGGFPCQPWSVAGKQRGTDDPRHLWPEMARVIEECRPRWVFAENVSLAAFEEPWRDLRGLGYRVPPALCLAAADVGAPHLRRRWWLLAGLSDSDRRRQPQQPQRDRAPKAGVEASQRRDAIGLRAPLGDPSREGLAIGQGARGQRAYAAIAGAGWWAAEPGVCRVAHGVAARVDRLRALGNGQVPLCAATAFRALMSEHWSEKA